MKKFIEITGKKGDVDEKLASQTLKTNQTFKYTSTAADLRLRYCSRKEGRGGMTPWRPEQFDRRLKGHRHRLWFVASVASHLVCPSPHIPCRSCQASFLALTLAGLLPCCQRQQKLIAHQEEHQSQRLARPTLFLYPIGLPLWHFHFIRSWVYFALKLLRRELLRFRPPFSSELSLASGPGKPTPRPKLWHSLGAKSLMEFVYGIALPPAFRSLYYPLPTPLAMPGPSK